MWRISCTTWSPDKEWRKCWCLTRAENSLTGLTKGFLTHGPQDYFDVAPVVQWSGWKNDAIESHNEVRQRQPRWLGCAHQVHSVFVYQTSKNDSTEFTLFESMFGRVPVLIIEMEIRSKPSSINSLSDKVGDAPPDFSEKQNIDKAQERRKKSYDAKHLSSH